MRASILEAAAGLPVTVLGPRAVLVTGGNRTGNCRGGVLSPDGERRR